MTFVGIGALRVNHNLLIDMQYYLLLNKMIFDFLLHSLKEMEAAKGSVLTCMLHDKHTPKVMNLSLNLKVCLSPSVKYFY